MQREFRYLGKTEVRAVGNGSALKLEGYASVFNITTQLPKFRETVKPGAFDRALRTNADVVCLWNHSSDLPLGRTTSGTLRLSTDSRGLHYVCDLPNTESARSYHESVRRGDVNGSSFGFMIDNQDGQNWSEQRDADGTMYIQRDITDLRLLDVSPVIYPAYQGTQVSARAIEIPMEVRSAFAAKKAGIVMPTVQDCLAITRRAAERHKREEEVARRRRDLLKTILN